MGLVGTSYRTAKRVKQGLGIGNFHRRNNVWWSFYVPGKDDKEYEE
jgi:hypothetical protein